MPRGGVRPGAGRPNKGFEDVKTLVYRAPLDVALAAINKGTTPLEYMLEAMRDPGTDQARRDRMAMAAAPYCHPRMAENQIGKKETRREKAKAANTDWMAGIAMRRGDKRADA